MAPRRAVREAGEGTGGELKAYSPWVVLARCRFAEPRMAEVKQPDARSRSIEIQSWDAEDRRLRLTMARKVGQVLSRFEQRGLVKGVGTRGRATRWKLA